MRLDRVAVSTQTPLLRQPPAGGLLLDTHGRTQGVQVPRLSDPHITPGGVSRMVLQTVQAWRGSGDVAGDIHWFSLQPEGAERLRLDEVGIELHHLRMPPDELRAYA